MARVRVAVSISLPPSLVTNLDAFCEQEQMTRSEVMRTALRRYISDVRIHTHEKVPEITAAPKAVPASKELPPKIPPAGKKWPLKSELVELVMPNASPKAKREATRRWFGFLQTLDEIAREMPEQRRESKKKRGYIDMDGTHGNQA